MLGPDLLARPNWDEIRVACREVTILFDVTLKEGVPMQDHGEDTKRAEEEEAVPPIGTDKDSLRFSFGRGNMCLTGLSASAEPVNSPRIGQSQVMST
jgi:hypothetical protein